MKNVVSSSWLKENLDNENIVLVDCRFNLMDKEYGKRSYEEGHIKGAVRIDIEKDLAQSISKNGGRHPLPSIEDLKDIVKSIGISNDSIVVIYDDGDLAGPSRFWWILKYLGHREVYILDGGMTEFKKSGGEISTETNSITKGKFEVNLQESMRVDMNYVKKRLNDKKVALIDSRENKRYIGEFEPVDFKVGHIPGAINYFWMDILDINDDTIHLKSNKDLENLFDNLRNYDEVIVYCGSGITACANTLALDEIGIKSKVYPGSFSDWISYEDNEIETI